MNKRSIGTFYEEAGIAFLESHGITVIDHNVHCGRLGEIDLIGRGEGCLIFIECKYRAKGGMGLALEAVTPAKQKTIRRCAEYYLKWHGLKIDEYIRFDVLAWDGEEFNWIKNAF